MSAVSTIASEDAEEEEKAVHELDNADAPEVQSEETPESVAGEEKEPTDGLKPAEPAVSQQTADGSASLEQADDSKSPEPAPGNSLLETVTQTMASVVTAVEETVLGEKPADDSTKSVEATPVSAGDSTNSADDKPVPAAQSTDPIEGDVKTGTLDIPQEQTVPEIVEHANVDAQVGPDQPGGLDPTYTIAIVGNKYNTQNFW